MPRVTRTPKARLTDNRRQPALARNERGRRVLHRRRPAALRRRAARRHAGRPRGAGSPIAGGVPGVNAVLEMEGDDTLVVHGQPRSARRRRGWRSEMRDWLGQSTTARAPRRRIIQTTEPYRSRCLRRRANDRAARGRRSRCPCCAHGHLPAVHVMVNGQGPFRFAIDTGGAGTARIDTALAERLGLVKVGEMRGGDPSGRNAQTMALVAIDSLQIGGARFEGLQAAVRDMKASRRCRTAREGGRHPRLRALRRLPPHPRLPGATSSGSAAASSARGQRARRAGLYPRARRPTARITVAGREMDAHVDAGSMGGISLPEAEAARLPLAAAPPKIVGRAQTLGNTLRDQGRAARR